MSRDTGNGLSQVREGESPVHRRPVRVLILDDSNVIRDAIRRRLSAYPFYDCREAVTARVADHLLREEGPFHVCTYDLGITDMNDDQYELLRRYCSETAFVVVTGEACRETCFEARGSGAIDLIDKLHIKDRACVQRINYAFLRAFVGVPMPAGNYMPMVETIAESIIRYLPSDTGELRTLAGCSHAYVKKICSERLSGPPGALCAACRGYCAAFARYDVLPEQVRRLPTK